VTIEPKVLILQGVPPIGIGAVHEHGSGLGSYIQPARETTL